MQTIISSSVSLLASRRPLDASQLTPDVFSNRLRCQSRTFSSHLAKETLFRREHKLHVGFLGGYFCSERQAVEQQRLISPRLTGPGHELHRGSRGLWRAMASLDRAPNASQNYEDDQDARDAYADDEYDEDEDGAAPEGEDEEEPSRKRFNQGREMQRQYEGSKEERRPFLERIVERAKAGDPAGAENALVQMSNAGLRPGPRAYHGVVVAYVRARDPDGALGAMRRQHASGDKALMETYIELVRAYAMVGDAQKAEKSLGAMERAGYESSPAWLVLVTELFYAGCVKEALRCYDRGISVGYSPTLEVFDLVIEALCAEGRWDDATSVLLSMEMAACRPTARQFNHIIRAQVDAGSPTLAMRTFDRMQQTEVVIQPDVHSFNHLIRGYARAGRSDSVSCMLEVLGFMLDRFHTRPNAQTYAYVLEGWLNAGDMRNAVRVFRQLRKAAAREAEVAFAGGNNSGSVPGGDAEAALLAAVGSKAASPQSSATAVSSGTSTAARDNLPSSRAASSLASSSAVGETDGTGAGTHQADKEGSAGVAAAKDSAAGAVGTDASKEDVAVSWRAFQRMHKEGLASATTADASGKDKEAAERLSAAALAQKAADEARMAAASAKKTGAGATAVRGGGPGGFTRTREPEAVRGGCWLLWGPNGGPLAAFVKGLATEGMAPELLEVLSAVTEEGVPLAEAPFTWDGTGASLVTAWMAPPRSPENAKIAKVVGRWSKRAAVTGYKASLPVAENGVVVRAAAMSDYGVVDENADVGGVFVARKNAAGEDTLVLEDVTEAYVTSRDREDDEDEEEEDVDEDYKEEEEDEEGGAHGGPMSRASRQEQQRPAEQLSPAELALRKERAAARAGREVPYAHEEWRSRGSRRGGEDTLFEPERGGYFVAPSRQRLWRRVGPVNGQLLQMEKQRRMELVADAEEKVQLALAQKPGVDPSISPDLVSEVLTALGVGMNDGEDGQGAGGAGMEDDDGYGPGALRSARIGSPSGRLYEGTNMRITEASAAVHGHSLLPSVTGGEGLLGFTPAEALLAGEALANASDASTGESQEEGGASAGAWARYNAGIAGERLPPGSPGQGASGQGSSSSSGGSSASSSSLSGSGASAASSADSYISVLSEAEGNPELIAAVEEWWEDPELKAKRGKLVPTTKLKVSDLKTELEFLGQSTEGTRPALYKRLQEARGAIRRDGREIFGVVFENGIFYPPRPLGLMDQPHAGGVPGGDRDASKGGSGGAAGASGSMGMRAMQAAGGASGESRYPGPQYGAGGNSGGAKRGDSNAYSQDKGVVSPTSSSSGASSRGGSKDASSSAAVVVSAGVTPGERAAAGVADAEVASVTAQDVPDAALSSSSSSSSGSAGSAGGDRLLWNEREILASLHELTMWERDVREMQAEARAIREWAAEMEEFVFPQVNARNELAIAMGVLDKVERLGYAASPVDLVTLLFAATGVGAPVAIASLMRRMMTIDLPLPRSSYLAAATACLNAGDGEAALVVLEAMEAAGLVPGEALLARVSQVAGRQRQKQQPQAGSPMKAAR
eukprot:jgi/Mesvir1/4949/Mv04571-RA.1